jgi:hypothetical protein
MLGVKNSKPLLGVQRYMSQPRPIKTYFFRQIESGETLLLRCWQGPSHSYASSAMDRWVDTDTIDRYYWSTSLYILFPNSVAAGPPWGSARELSLSPLTRRGDPPPLLAPGRVTPPSLILGVKLVLLWGRCYGKRVV